MHLSFLGLVDFRSYAQAQIALEPGATVIVGLNGQGKTNLIEAIGFLASQSSHRVAKDTPLVRSGAERAIVSGRVQWQDREQSVELEINASGANRARVAGAPRRPRDALGILRAVLFAPEDLALVKGDPAGRRRFIDDLLVAMTPRYAGVLADLDRVVKQRSALLKSAAVARRRGSSSIGVGETLAVWNDQLAHLGATITAERLRILSLLADPLAQSYQAVAPGSAPAAVGYASSWWDESALITTSAPPPDLNDLRDALITAMAAREREELERGMTLVGPQRDDLLFTLGDLPVKGYASHGESWSVALALRLASYRILADGLENGGDPVLLLDDVFAELDEQRRLRLAELVGPAEQVLVTAAVAADVPAALRGRSLSVVRNGESEVS